MNNGQMRGGKQSILSAIHGLLSSFWLSPTVSEFGPFARPTLLRRNKLSDIKAVVDIGTVTPTEKLDVVGNIHASGTIQSGNSIIIDGMTDKITASSGTINFDNENLVSKGKARFGPSNSNTGPDAFVVGQNNTASADNSSVLGGINNNVSGVNSVIGGGFGNGLSGGNSFLGGGSSNGVTSIYATLSGVNSQQCYRFSGHRQRWKLEQSPR